MRRQPSLPRRDVESVLGINNDSDVQRDCSELECSMDLMDCDVATAVAAASSATSTLSATALTADTPRPYYAAAAVAALSVPAP